MLRTAAQRRLSRVRAVARVAQSALLREVPATVTAGRMASRYVSAAAEARVGGDILEVVSEGGRTRWLIGDTRGKGLPAVRLASVATTSFRDACAQPGLSLAEVARVVDRSVTLAAGEEDFVTALFAEFDPRGWLELVTCGHPPPLRLDSGGGLQALTPSAYATPLGLHPAMTTSTFSVGEGDRVVFYTDGLLEARDRAGRYFRLEDCADLLRGPDLEAAADELLNRLVTHTGRRLDDDVAVLLFEAAPWPAVDHRLGLREQPGAPGPRMILWRPGRDPEPGRGAGRDGTASAAYSCVAAPSTILHSVAWKAVRSAGGIAARRSLMAASRAMATSLTTLRPAGVACGMRTRRSRSEVARTMRPSRSRRSSSGTRVDLSMPS